MSLEQRSINFECDPGLKANKKLKQNQTKIKTKAKEHIPESQKEVRLQHLSDAHVHHHHNHLFFDCLSFRVLPIDVIGTNESWFSEMCTNYIE